MQPRVHPIRVTIDLSELEARPSGFIAPIRHIIPGLMMLMLTAFASMAAGFYNVYALAGHHGDIHILFMLAAAVYPGPYFLYALFCFFLFHGFQSRWLTLVFYLSCGLMAVAPFIAIKLNLGTLGLSLPQQLDAALWQNFFAALAIGAVFIGVELLLARRARSRRRM